MALFKILKGNKSALPSTKTEGYAYITKDEHKMYIDTTNTERIALNADTADRVPYGVCSNLTGVVAKTVTVPNIFTLTTGSLVAVKFTNPGGTTTSDNAITLNVNGTGAKSIYYRGARIPNENIEANEIFLLLYNGTQYEVVGDSYQLITSINDSNKTSVGVPTVNAVVGAINTYSTKVEQSSTNGKIKINGTDTTVYTHPTHAEKASGLYKITVDSLGHVSAAAAVTKADITGLGIPAQDTTYSNATTSAAGLMSATDKSKLDGIATGANKYTLPIATANALGGVKSGGDISVNSSSGAVTINNAAKVAHTLTIGTQVYDGSADVTITVYDGTYV